MRVDDATKRGEPLAGTQKSKNGSLFSFLFLCRFYLFLLWMRASLIKKKTGRADGGVGAEPEKEKNGKKASAGRDARMRAPPGLMHTRTRSRQTGGAGKKTDRERENQARPDDACADLGASPTRGPRQEKGAGKKREGGRERDASGRIVDRAAPARTRLQGT